jgi:hypothetical protein
MQPISPARDMTIDQWGITYAGASSGEPWRTPWENIRRIGIDGPGHGIRIRTSRPMGGKWINLDGCPNGIVAHHLIQHAVARFDVPIHHIDRLRGPERIRACQQGRTMRAG